MGIVQKQGIQNTVIGYAGIIIGFVNLIVVQPFFLSPEEIGLTRVLFSFSSLIAVFLPLGIGNIIYRYFPKFRNPEKGHHGFLGFALIFPVAGFIVVAALLYLLKDFFVAQYIKESPLFTEYYNYVLPFSFVLGLINVLNVYSFSIFKTTFPALLNEVIVRVLTMVVISVYFLQWVNLDFFVGFFVFVYVIQLSILIFYILTVDKPRLKPTFAKIKQENLREMLQYGFLLSVASVASLGLRYLDAIMIGKYMALSFVGIYTIAAFIPAVMEAPLNALDKIAYSKIAHALAADNRKEMEEIYYKSSRYLLLIGGLLFLGININIESLLSFLPEEYHQGANIVLIISVGTLINLASGANSSLVYSSDYYRFGSFLLILLVIIAFINNIILIPRYGIEGAAIATAISTFLNSLMRFVFILVIFKIQPYNVKTLLLVLLIAACFMLNFFIPKFDTAVADIVIRSFIITVVYGAGVYFLRIVPELQGSQVTNFITNITNKIRPHS